MLGVTLMAVALSIIINGLASHPETRISSGLMGHLARMQTIKAFADLLLN